MKGELNAAEYVRGRRRLRWIIPALGIACLAAAAIWAIQERRLHPAAIWLAVIGLGGFLTIFATGELANLKHYANSVLYSSFVIGTGVLLYVLAARYDFQLDLTPQKTHTLTDATRKFLTLLRKDVQIVVFDIEDRPYADLLDRFATLSPRISWSVRDPRHDPVFTRQFDPEVPDKTIYIRSGEKKKRISAGEFDEASITNGIVEVTRDVRIKIYFLSGHGELAFDSQGRSEPRSLMEFQRFLASRAMDVEELDLAQRGFIPRDASLIVLAGPARDLYPIEARQIEDHLAGGGKLLVFFDLPSTMGDSVDYINLVQLLRRQGIDDEEKVIIDLQGSRLLGHPLKIPVLWFNDQHPVTQNLMKQARSTVALSLVRSLRPMDPAPRDRLVTPLIGSSAEAWSESFVNLGSKQKAPQTYATQPLGWAVRKTAAGKEPGDASRLVVYGTSEFVRDSYLTTQNTAALLMLNSVNWLTEQEDRVPVPDRVVAGTPMFLNDSEMLMIMVVMVMAVPGLLFFGGIIYVRLLRRG